MAIAPPLATPRLRLLPFSEQHLTEKYLGWLNDPETVRYSEQRFRKSTLASCRAYRQTFETSPDFFWAIERAAPDAEHLGNITAHPNTNHGTAELGILMGKSSQGQGYATEAWLGICDYLFRQQNIRKISAGTLETNQSMLALMKRTGMAVEWRRQRQCLWEGREVDIIGACVFRADWLARYSPGQLFTS